MLRTFTAPKTTLISSLAWTGFRFLAVRVANSKQTSFSAAKVVHRPPRNPNSVNFGPAHPAAHGVFRLVLGIREEILIAAEHTQGLLWRCTENLIEYRQPDLNSGYFARLDYVSFVAQEIGYGAEKSKTSGQIGQQLGVLLTLNSISNHLLNVCCTVGDSGALGAILWGFEIRELLAEATENATGARLHVNSALCGLSRMGNLSVGGTSQPFSISNAILPVLDLLFSSVTASRITTGRFIGNFAVTFDEVFESALCTGWISASVGVQDCIDFGFMQGENGAFGLGSVQIVGNSTAFSASDSLVRHCGRLFCSLGWAITSEIAAISTVQRDCLKNGIAIVLGRSDCVVVGFRNGKFFELFLWFARRCGKSSPRKWLSVRSGYPSESLPCPKRENIGIGSEHGSIGKRKV